MTQRENKDWIAFGCAAAYAVCFLALPFYGDRWNNLNGWRLIQFSSGWFVLPLLLGAVIAFLALFFHPWISIAGGGVTLLATLALLLGGGSSAFSLGWVSISAGPGVGGIFCLLLCLGFIVAEIVMMNRKPGSVKPTDDFLA